VETVRWESTGYFSEFKLSNRSSTSTMHEHRSYGPGAYLYMATDAGLSLGVVVGGVLIVGAILVGTWFFLKDPLNLALDSVPGGIDHAAIQIELESGEVCHLADNHREHSDHGHDQGAHD
jgi:hypothetical protein